MERKIEMKIRYFIKEQMETSTLHHHGILTQNSGKTSRHKSRKNKKKNKIAHHKLALTHDASTPRTV
jgi:hypothetical protein